MAHDEVAGAFSQWSRDPDLAGAAAHYRAELRAEAAEYEALAARDRLRDRSLGEVAVELLARGDVVAIALPGRSFTGTLRHAAGDLACLRTAAGEDVDVCLTGVLALRVVEAVRDGGRSRGPGAASFTARLAEHEAAATIVEVGARVPDGGVVGRIEAASHDHVVVACPDGARWFVARRAIDYVLPRP